MSDNVLTYIADDELATRIKSAAESDGRIMVIAEGKMYELQIASSASRHELFKDYDPVAAREALHASAGILRDLDIDVEEWLKEIKESRRQDTPGRPGW